LRGRRLAWALLLLLLGGGAVLGRPRGTSRAEPRSLPNPSSPSRSATVREHVPSRSGSAFDSPSECSALRSSGARLARPAGIARLASWNLRWFPDGKPGNRAGGSGVDLGWLACTLWWLDADVIAVQEVKQTPEAERALAQLLGELNRLAGARYVSRLDDCGGKVQQHVGLIWNEARVSGSSVRTIAELNPHGDPCRDQLRPGLAARLRFSGGLDLTAVSAHFKSMSDERAYRLRARSFSALSGVARDELSQTGDGDLLLLGDLNTAGCDACTPAISPEAEQELWRRQLAEAGLRLVPADAAGSERHQGRLTLLDHAVATATMRELQSDARTQVVGPCAAAGRRSTALSDHCPIVLDLNDRDLD
jgi:endonuclease/exonuclease/phosphatase family metal-dependent hydrolase